MKELLSLISCLFVIFLSAGCAQQNEKTQKQAEITSRASDEDKFPQVMVGVWEARLRGPDKWGIKFEPDGSILKVIHSLAGPVTLSEGGVYLDSPDPNLYAVFAMGPCEAKYHRQKDELEVKIALDHYEMRLPNGTLEGRIEDYFRGPVSKDGKSWAVNWVSYGWLEGAEPPDINLIDQNPEKLVFTKIDVNDTE